MSFVGTELPLAPSLLSGRFCLARLVPNRRVGDVEVNVLWVAVPLGWGRTLHCE
jgi:hypothetical protein